MSEYVRFNTNIPEEVALRYADGKQVQSRIDGGADQMFYSLAGGRGMYLPLHVAEKIRELNIGPGQRFTICKAEVKNGNRHGIQWQVQRVDPDPRLQEQKTEPANPRPEPPAPPPAKVSGAAASVQGAAGDPGTSQSTAPANGHAAANGVHYWDPKTEWLQCADDAIDALVAARDRAAARGLPVQFTGEDLRQVAATLYIDRGKDRRCPNGGLR